MKVCVLLGGASSERSVSLESGKAVAEALKLLGHEVIYADPSIHFEHRHSLQTVLAGNDLSNRDFLKLQDGDESAIAEYIPWMKHKNVDIVFNAMHGGNGENGMIAAHLQLADLPFTGSGFHASSLAMDKFRCKCLFMGASIPTADFELCEIPIREPERIDFPLVIKPSKAGSSVGLYVEKERTDIFEQTRDALRYDDQVLIERFIEGRELTVPVISGKAYPVVEIDPEGGVYDFTRKYTKGKSRYFVPARISEAETDEVQNLALRVWKLLGLANYARIDFRMDPRGNFHCLEANTLPGMTETSLLPKSLAYAGVEFSQLLNLILDDAIKIRS